MRVLFALFVVAHITSAFADGNSAGPPPIQGTATANGGDSFDTQLAEARQVAIRVMETISTDRVRATLTSDAVKDLLIREQSQFVERLKTLLVDPISKDNGEEPLYVLRNGVKKRVEAIADPEKNLVHIDRDLTQGHDRLRLAKLLIHEAGHLLNYDDTFEAVLVELALTAVQASQVSPVEVIAAENPDASTYELMRTLYWSSTEEAGVNDFPLPSDFKSLKRFQCVMSRNNQDSRLHAHVQLAQEKQPSQGPALPERVARKVTTVIELVGPPISSVADALNTSSYFWKGLKNFRTPQRTLAACWEDNGGFTVTFYRKSGNLIAFRYFRSWISDDWPSYRHCDPQFEGDPFESPNFHEDSRAKVDAYGYCWQNKE